MTSMEPPAFGVLCRVCGEQKQVRADFTADLQKLAACHGEWMIPTGYVSPFDDDDGDE